VPDIDADPRNVPLADPRLVALWRQWLVARGSRLMPSRRAIDPTGMPQTLPHLFVYDYDRAADRFFCRLAGEEINIGAGTNCTRRHLEEIFPPHIVAALRERYGRVVHAPTLAHMHGVIYMVNDVRVPGERLLLPLSEDGITATGLIGGAVYHRPATLPSGVLADEPVVAASFPGLPPAGWMPPDSTPKEPGM